MKRTTLRRTILFYVSPLLLGLIVVMLAYVSWDSESFVDGRIEEELREGSERVAVADAARIERLRSAATTVAAFPELYALMQLGDVPTLHDVLETYRLKVAGVDLLLVLNPEGRLVSRSDREDSQPIPGIDQGQGIVQLESGFYHFASAEAGSTGVNLGTVIAGQRIDDEFAKTLGDLSSSEIVIVADGVIGSNTDSRRFPWQQRAEWESQVPDDKEFHRIEAKSETYVARAVLLGQPEGLRPLALILQSRTAAMKPFREIQVGLLILGLVAAAVGIAGSALLAKKVTAPVGKLVEGMEHVAAGNFDFRIDINSRDEIGTLADSFNTMIVGLRERADMQKFVSQSTVDMIQATTSKKVSAGERVTLTILFSDMRGFTSMSENRPPEEIVRILNECLSLQAAKVKKFGGDIDKFVGDCVVALFTGEDMELKAIRCAVEIHKAILERNAAKPEDYPLEVGVGIATGEVILGSIGSDDRLDYTAIGSHVNLSSRICSLAGPRETLMAQSTYDRVEGLVAAERLEPVQVKGFKAPVPLYRMAVKSG